MDITQNNQLIILGIAHEKQMSAHAKTCEWHIMEIERKRLGWKQRKGREILALAESTH